MTVLYLNYVFDWISFPSCFTKPFQHFMVCWCLWKQSTSDHIIISDYKEELLNCWLAALFVLTGRSFRNNCVQQLAHGEAHEEDIFNSRNPLINRFTSMSLYRIRSMRGKNNSFFWLMKQNHRHAKRGECQKSPEHRLLRTKQPEQCD